MKDSRERQNRKANTSLQLVLLVCLGHHARGHECCLLFGLLTGTYTLMYNFALDLNQPFDGVYQVRRSAAATSLLGARLLLDGELPDGVLAIERGKQLGAEPGPADPRPC